MKKHHIQSIEDVRAISAKPYEYFMAHEHLYDALSEAGAVYAQRKALTYIEDPDLSVPAASWTYAELLEHINQTANLFCKLANGDEPRVAMLLPNIPEAHLVLWGGETAGVVCPVNYMLEASHIAELLRVARCNILVTLGPNTELDIWSKIADVAPACPELRHVLTVGAVPSFKEFLPATQDMPADAIHFPLSRGPQRLAALFHTGGTTGSPKLAQHTHRNQLHSAWSAAQMYAMDERDVILNGFPLFHVAGAFVYGLSALLSGAEIVLPTRVGLRNSKFMGQYWKFVDRHQVTLLATVPTVISSLLAIDRGDASLTSVRALLTGGSPLPNELATSFERSFSIPVRNILGMTESAGVVSIEPFLAPRTTGSCGLPLPFTEVLAVTNEGDECAPGQSGIVRLRGPNVSPGYTDAKRDTGTFDKGWLISGDIGHLDEIGNVFITGRSKDVIIRSGHNIDPQVIEEALLKHPDVLVAAAVGEPDEYAGELPVAFVSLRAGASVDPSTLCQFANARIPERPAYIKRVHVLQSVPLTAIGKVYKPKLRALACASALSERLAKGGLSTFFDVSVEETTRGTQVQFLVRNNRDFPSHEAFVRDLMRPFPLEYLFVPAPVESET